MTTKTIEIEVFGTKRTLHLTLSTPNLVIPIQGEGGVNFRDSGRRNAEGHEIWTPQPNPIKTTHDFIEWLSGAAIYIGYARYAQLGGHGFVCVSKYDEADDLQRWTEDLDAGDDDALRAADSIIESGAWIANDPDPAVAMAKLVSMMEHYYFHELNREL